MNGSDHSSIILAVIAIVVLAGAAFLRSRRSAKEPSRLQAVLEAAKGQDHPRAAVAQAAWALAGRTRLSWFRIWRNLIVFLFLICAFVVLSISHPLKLAALFGGLAVGVCIGVYALRITTFEATPEGRLYYAGPLLPSIVALLPILLLLVWRFGFPALLADMARRHPHHLPLSLDPLTLLCLGPMVGYFPTYGLGLLRWRRKVRASRRGSAAA